jgi:hypothetical protein
VPSPTDAGAQPEMPEEAVDSETRAG